ncbi:MAG: acyltransferase [Pseudomonadota bacterium]
MNFADRPSQIPPDETCEPATVEKCSTGRSERAHFTTIDALRGVAALSVVLFHLGGAGLPKLNSPISMQLTSWGWAGVEIFFVISGFIIPFVMLKARFRWNDAVSFMARRFTRIWPPSAVLIALSVAQYAVATRLQESPSVEWAQPSATMIISNLLYAVPLTGHEWISGVFWTLAVEFQYYLFLALVFPLLASGRKWLMAAGVASLVSGLLPGAETILFLRYAIYFAMGGLCLLYRERLLERRPFLVALIVMAAVASIQHGFLPTAFSVATVLAIAFVSLRNPVLTFLGTISYLLYLVHILVASSFEYVLVSLFDPSSPAARLLGQLVCIALAIAGAWIFYRLVERPSIAWSRRVGRSAPQVHAARGTARSAS